MSVPKNKREQGDLAVITKTHELRSYTKMICTKETIFPKRERWCEASMFIKEAHDVEVCFVRANAVKVVDTHTARKRIDYIRDGIELLTVILNDINYEYSYKKCENDRFTHWATVANECQNLARNWFKTELKRYEKEYQILY